ncbi:MAG TPA: FecR family protein [Pyrinomonadaceae bacterium]|nr:FecR family protein [Pyrinomonadaceae bacterium]
MNKNVFRIAAFAVLAIVLPSIAAGQSRTPTSALGDQYVISAKAGGVNLVEGPATVVRADGRTNSLIKGDKIEVGDRVSTEAGARAEVLLNPGSYLRLGPNTSFEFESTSLDDLSIDVSRGSAMLEVFAGREFAVRINTPGASYSLIESGIYRVDVNGGQSTLSVWKGEALVLGGNETKVKSGRRAVVTGGAATVSKFNKDEDALAEWSKDRGKLLAKNTSRLRPDNLRNPLINSFNNNLWNMYSSFGVWVFDPFMGGYCFLPFGQGWSSPYGYWYGYDIWRYRLPWYVYYPPAQGPGGGGGGGTTPPPTTGTRVERRTVGQPPFEKLERNSSVRRSTTWDGPSYPSAPRAPVYSPPVITRTPPTPPLSGGGGTINTRRP